MSTSTVITTTIPLDDAMIDGLSWVGKPVKINEGHRASDLVWTVHSVEGVNWYAFQSGETQVTLDAGMTRAEWITEPIAMIIPSGSKIGEGFGQSVGLSLLVRAEQA